MMKTSEDDKKFLSELFQEYADLVDGKGIQRAHHMLAQYKLDAFKAGAEWAAGIRNDGSALFKRDAILSASSNLKEIPK